MKIKSFFKKIKKFFSRKKNLKWVILAILVIVLVIIFSMRKKADQVIIENHDLYQYTTGFRIDFKGKIKLDKDKNITTISFGDDIVNLNSIPLYYADDDKVLFPESMMIVKPKEGKQFKINYYSTLYRDLDMYSIKDGKINKTLTNAIIYDANDLYFIIDDVHVKYGETDIELSAMSYIVVDTLNKTLEVYDKQNDTFNIYEEVSEDVIISNDDYSINASKDLMYYNGKSRLFLKKIDVLKQYS